MISFKWESVKYNLTCLAHQKRHSIRNLISQLWLGIRTFSIIFSFLSTKGKKKDFSFHRWYGNADDCRFGANDDNLEDFEDFDDIVPTKNKPEGKPYSTWWNSKIRVITGTLWVESCSKFRSKRLLWWDLSECHEYARRKLDVSSMNILWFVEVTPLYPGQSKSINRKPKWVMIQRIVKLQQAMKHREFPAGERNNRRGLLKQFENTHNEWTWFLQTFIKLIIYNFTPNTNSPVQLKLSIRIQSPFHFSVMLDTARHHKFKLTFIWSERENMVTRFPPSPPGFAC